MTSERQLTNLVNEALAIQNQETKEAGALGFTARSLVQATMPHSKPKEIYFSRKNGDLTVSMIADPEIGLPYGSIPRLLLAWMTSEVVKKDNREIILGRSLNAFVETIGLIPSGGRLGTTPRVKDQMMRLFACTVSCVYKNNEEMGIKKISPVEEAYVWWNPKRPDDPVLFESKIILSEAFYNEIKSFPVPLDIRVLKALKGSPMALDIYSWLTYRMSYLHRDTAITWEGLQMQFGAEYKELKTFKFNFLKHMKAVLFLYPEAKVLSTEQGLLLRPSPTHVKAIENKHTSTQ